MLLPLVAVLSTMHYEGDVPTTGGDYAEVAFEVPQGTVEIQVSHTDGSSFVILDWGVWSPVGFRGWGGGLVDDAVIGVEQSSRGYLPGQIFPGTWTVVIGKAKLDPATGGHYAIDVTCRDAATLPVLAKAAFSPTVLAPERRWYRGDFHVHSEQSGDASATFGQISALARSRGLDFVNLSDHNTVSQHALIAALQPSLPDLLLLRGAEITTYAGHGNAVGLSEYVDHRIGYQGRTISSVISDVDNQGGLFIVNHPTLDLGGACIGCAWKHETTPWAQVAGLEVMTGNWDIGVNAFVPGAIALWDSLLDQGYRIAAVGGSDDHTAGVNEGPTGAPIGSPTTLVLADNLSEAAIIAAVRAGRTIVQLRGPDDPVVSFTVEAHDGHDAEIGEEIQGVGKPQLKIHVAGGQGTFAQIWRDGEKLATTEVTSDDFTTTIGDSIDNQLHRYRLELITDANQRLVVTSHIYVGGETVFGFCACRTGSGNPPHSGALELGGIAVLVGLVVRRRPRN